MASRARQLSKLLSSDLLTVDVNNNRIGVNSTSPEDVLDVVGQQRVGSGETAGSGRDLHVYSDLGTPVRIETTKTTSNIEFMDSGTSSIFNVKVGSVGDNLSLKSESDTTFLTGSGTGTERMRITGVGGSVGIGTTNPDSILHIEGTKPRLTLSDTGTNAHHRINGDSSVGNLAFDVDYDSATSAPSCVVNIKGEEKVRVTGIGSIGIGTATPISKLSVHGLSEEDVIHISVGNTAGSTFANIRGDNEAGIRIRGGGSFDGGTIELAGGIRDSDPGIIKFSTGTGSSVNEAMRIAENRYIFFGGYTTDFPGSGNTDGGLMIERTSSGMSFFVSRHSNTPMYVNRNNNGDVISCRRSGNDVGAVRVDASNTFFDTSSDYRLKENIVGLTSAISRVKQLEPKRFNFIRTPEETIDGFLAHEVDAVVPHAVYGEYDGVDGDGNPDYQKIDTGKLIPLLTAALKESISEIEALKARVAVLEDNL